MSKKKKFITLGEALEKYGDQEIQRNCWMYIGPANNTAEILQRFEEYRNKIESRFKTNGSYITQYPFKMPSVSVSNEDEMFKNCLDYMDRARKIVNDYQSNKEYLDTYTCPLDRLVIDEYETPCYGKKAISILGLERGVCWDKDEYEETFHKKKKEA